MTILKEEEDHAMAVYRAKFEAEKANQKQKQDAAMLLEGREEADRAVKVTFETAKAVKRMAVKDVAGLEQRAQQSGKRSAEARANLELLEKQEYHINKRQRTTLQVGQVDKRETHL